MRRFHWTQTNRQIAFVNMAHLISGLLSKQHPRSVRQSRTASPSNRIHDPMLLLPLPPLDTSVHLSVNRGGRCIRLAATKAAVFWDMAWGLRGAPVGGAAGRDVKKTRTSAGFLGASRAKLLRPLAGFPAAQHPRASQNTKSWKTEPFYVQIFCCSGYPPLLGFKSI